MLFSESLQFICWFSQPSRLFFTAIKYSWMLFNKIHFIHFWLIIFSRYYIQHKPHCVFNSFFQIRRCTPYSFIKRSSPSGFFSFFVQKDSRERSNISISVSLSQSILQKERKARNAHSPWWKSRYYNVKVHTKIMLLYRNRHCVKWKNMFFVGCVCVVYYGFS